MTGPPGHSDLAVRRTAIPGLLVVDLPLAHDARGWFKENWQRAKMTALGLPDFTPVQHSVALNTSRGTTRGIHAEPWDKFVSAVHGEWFGAWVDLRDGPTFGVVHTETVGVDRAVWVPRGVGNAYQTLVDDTVYSYLVTAHWSPTAAYTHLNLADGTLAIDWPIALEQAEISAKDRHHPRLADLTPYSARGTLILGGDGQVGRALRVAFPEARVLNRTELDLSDPAAVEAFDLGGCDLILNAAAYTAVDDAETETGRRTSWTTNAASVAALARQAARNGSTLVHFSTDYVFDGRDEIATEDTALSPLGVYGQSKAAGELAVSVLPRHYLLRTSWVVGDGANFVTTMRRLARDGVSPQVVDDQVGRLTFASTLARAVRHLVEVGAPFGTYQVTEGGQPGSWADVARAVFEHEGRDPQDVEPVTTAGYAHARPAATAPRPPHSVLDLSRIQGTGFDTGDQWQSLRDYLTRQ